VFNSQSTRQVIEQLVGSGKPCITAYPGGDRFNSQISAEQIILRANRPGPLHIVFVGNLIPRKGLHILLDALQRLPKEAWRLNVIGNQEIDPAYMRGIYRKADRAELRDNLTYSGVLDGAALSHCLEESQVLAIPSSYEGFGIVYLEGMGYGLPPIATTAGAAGEFIQSGKNGILIAPQDSMALADQLQSLHENRELLMRLSLAARQTYQAHPTWEQTCQKIRQFLLDWQPR
jgi:glycosyltransferase involved in cell wall biosynthesis